MDHDLKVVLGASGGAGSALVAELTAQGHRVRAVSRHPIAGLPHGAEHLAADIATDEGASAAVAEASVVYHAAQPDLSRWLEEFPAMTRTVAAAAARAAAKLVFVDNLYLYGPVAGPMTEDTPHRPNGPRAAMREQMAETLLSEHAAGRLRVTIGRASDFFGPGAVDSALGETVFAAALGERTVRWLGPLDVPHTMSYLPDVARALTILGATDAADGRAWHLPAAEPLTARAFTALIERSLGGPVKLKALGPLGFWVASRFVPVLREIAETRYQWQAPFESNAWRFEATFGPLATTPHDEAVRATVTWWRARLAPDAAAPSGLTPAPVR